tara:strand:- start:1588 stop:1872 length:285 start_codon:yes stop_codon:yes gene_type:complete
MDKDKKQKPTQLELNYDARVANIPDLQRLNPDLNVGSVVESVSVSGFDSGTPDMFDSVFDYIDLKKKYPALRQAWDHYQSVLKMCKLKEAEDKR